MHELLASLVGGDRANRLLSTVLLPSQWAGEEQPRGQVARATISLALGLVLLDASNAQGIFGMTRAS